MRRGYTIKMKKLMGQILKFGVVGGIAFVIDYGLMVFLKEIVGFHYLLASGFSFTVSVMVNYILSITWVFETQKDNNRITEFIVFIVLSVIGLGINQVVMWITVEYYAISYLIAKIAATAIVMLYNFITRKLFIERKISITNE